MDVEGASILESSAGIKALKLQLKHLKAASNVCVENSVPMPFVANFLSKAAIIAEDFGSEKRINKNTRCCRCSLYFRYPNSFCLRLIKHHVTNKRRKSATPVTTLSKIRKKTFISEKRVNALRICAVCKGCGCYINCGNFDYCRGQIDNESAIPERIVETTNRRLSLKNNLNKPSPVTTSTPISILRTPNSVKIDNDGNSKKLSSLRRRRKSAQKLQRMLQSEEAANICSPLSGLSGFLSSLNQNTN